MIEAALQIAKVVEDQLPSNLHIGLTGGVLYKEGVRKDIDFVIYSHECYDQIDTNELAYNKLVKMGFYNVENYGRVIKCKTMITGIEINVDFIVPESEDGEYS